MQECTLDEEHDDSYPNHEEVLNYLCGKNLKHWDLGQNSTNMECKEISKVENDIHPSTNNVVNIGGQMYSSNTKSVINLEENKDNNCEQLNDQDVPIVYKDNSQTVINGTEEDYALCTGESQNKLYVTLKTNIKLAPDGMYTTTCHWHPSQKNNEYSDYPCHRGSIILLTDKEVIDDSAVQQEKDFSRQNNTIAKMSHGCHNESSNSMQMEVNSDDLSLDSSDKLTEDTLVSSISLYSVNASSVEGDYIENKSPTHNTIDDVVYIPMQPHDFHQSNVTFGDKTFPLNTVMDGAYVGHDIAFQQN